MLKLLLFELVILPVKIVEIESSWPGCYLNFLYFLFKPLKSVKAKWIKRKYAETGLDGRNSRQRNETALNLMNKSMFKILVYLS